MRNVCTAFGLRLPTLVSVCFALNTYAAEPRPTNDGYQLELVAGSSEIVTPIGLTFDHHGRLLVVESNTHKRPADYDGPPSDRILIGSDSDGDGRIDQWSKFADGFRHAMNLLVRPDGVVLVVTRHRIVRLRDSDGDGSSDEESELIRLQTEDDYPHNGLGGVALLPDGSGMLIAMGENHGFPYRLEGADGTVLHGRGGAGGVFRTGLDGSGLERLAVGFWNPFSLTTTADGLVFAVDNDPDACPPCRLLQVVAGGDYGYRYQYGRAGTHPLQAWNGELPGTLPMVCGVGEAPTAIVVHAGSLWVTSWGDHRIERYRLIPRGASYSAEREVVVQGDADFRPTGMAVAPDGSLYFGDWVERDYEVHGQGRIWRLTLPAQELDDLLLIVKPEQWRWSSPAGGEISTALSSDDPFVHTAGVWSAAKQNFQVPPADDPRIRLGRLEALRLSRTDDVDDTLKSALADPSEEVRLYAVRWIADERITALRDQVAGLLDEPPPSSRYYLAVLAAVDWLDHEPDTLDSGITNELLARELDDPARSSAVHALALRLLSPDHPLLTRERLREYLTADYQPLRLEAVRTLAQQTNEWRFELLAAAARDRTQSDQLRAEAISGMAGDATQFRDELEQYASADEPLLRREAERALRLTRMRPMPDESLPPADDLQAWDRLMADPGDAGSGRRLFFSASGPRCSVCHQFGGRGGRIGPDLSQIRRNNTRKQLLESILKPSQEMAPHYQPYLLFTAEGKSYFGLRLAEGGDDGTEEYVDDAGEVFSLPSEMIEARETSDKSIMPDGLQTTMSVADMRDLVTFLLSEDSE